MKLVVDKEQMPVEVFSTMGCRTANGADINFTKEYYKENILQIINSGKLNNNRLLSAAQKDGRGNICPSTIILPTLAMEAKKKSEKKGENILDEFFKILNQAIEDCKDELIERYEWICAQSPASARFMYENNTMKGYKEKDGIKSAVSHGTLAIGQIGLSETLILLIGKNQLEEEGMKLGKQIEQLFKDKCNEYKTKYNLNFGVYYTPAESLCYTSMKKFQKKYGKIKDVSDKEFFTNSIHVPVYSKVSPFEKIDIESQLTGYSSAGCITYVEIGDEARNNEKAVEQIIDYAMDHDIPYFALNLKNNYCYDCGCDQVPEDTCPICGSTNIFKPRRVTGYLTGDYRKAFNTGKVAEVEARYENTEKLNWKNNDF